MAYQGYGLELGTAVVADIHDLVIGDTTPDLTIVLDMPLEAAFCAAGAARWRRRPLRGARPRLSPARSRRISRHRPGGARALPPARRRSRGRRPGARHRGARRRPTGAAASGLERRGWRLGTGPGGGDDALASGPRHTTVLVGQERGRADPAPRLRRRPHGACLAAARPAGHRQGHAGLPLRPLRAGAGSAAGRRAATRRRRDAGDRRRPSGGAPHGRRRPCRLRGCRARMGRQAQARTPRDRPPATCVRSHPSLR